MSKHERFRSAGDGGAGIFARMFPDRTLPLGVFRQIVRCVRPAGLLVLLASAGYCLWLSWFKWLNPQIDFPQELYFSWRLMEGDVFGRDIFWHNGALSEYWNALLFKIFGVSINTLVWANLATYVVIVCLAFRLLRLGFGWFPALVSSAFGIFIFGFGDYNGWGNYNYAAPYSHAATHGILLLLALLTVAARRHEGGKRDGWGEGSIYGLMALVKIEFVLAGGVVMALVWLHWLYTRGWARAWQPMLRSVAAWTGVQAAAWLVFFLLYWAKSDANWSIVDPELVTRCYVFRPFEWLADAAGWPALLALTRLAYAAADTAWSVLMPFKTQLVTSTFTELTTGVADWRNHLWLHIEVFAIGTLALAALAAAARLWLGRLPGKIRGVTTRHAAMAAVFVVASVFATWLAQRALGEDGSWLPGAHWSWRQMLAAGLGAGAGGLSLIGLWKWRGWHGVVPERMLLKNVTLHPALWGVPVLVGGYTLASQFVIWTGIARMFWGTLLTLAVVIAWRFAGLQRTRPGYVPRRLWVQALLVAVSVAMLARMFLFTRMYHYGFFQAILAGLVTFAFIFRTALAAGGRRHVARATVALALIGLFSVGVGKMVGLSAFYYRNKGTLIGKGGDAFYCVNPGYNPTGQALWMATEYVQKLLPPGETVVTLPEGIWVNYMLRLKSPIRFTYFLPGSFPEERYTEAIASLEAKRPYFIILAPRVNTQEFGVPYWGYDNGSGKKLVEWVVENYTEAGRVEDKGKGGDQTTFRMVIYKRKEAAQ